MKQSDAANILNLAGEITPKEVKQSYRSAAKKYHPDINPAGSEMMKIINEAFETLKEFSGTLENEEVEFSYPDQVNAALNAIFDYPGLKIEICGSWVWVTGETREHKETLKEAGFRYASKKKAWSYRPAGWKSRNRRENSMQDIREMHGSQEYKRQHRPALAAA